MNLNATSGLANGTPVVLHSVMFSDTAVADMIREKLAHAEPGEVIEIPVPHAVIVSVPHIDATKWKLKHKSLCSDTVTIPLTNQSVGDNVTLDDQKMFYKSHQYDLAFAVTFHKVQGQTVNKIILDLNKRPGALGSLDFHAIYVGLTRVAYRDDIRILPCHDGNHFQHLLNLKPNSNLKEWLVNVPKL
jgi:hypothetical protein